MRKTSIGGSALLEGIMMIGPHKKAIAVRKPDQQIDLLVEDLPKKSKIANIPVIRGSYALIYQMVMSLKALTYSASFYDLEEQDEKENGKDTDIQADNDVLVNGQQDNTKNDIEFESKDKQDNGKDRKKDGKKAKDKGKDKNKNDEALTSSAIFFSVTLSIVITVGLFILLPNFIIGLFKIPSKVINNLLEGVLRIAIFSAYLVLATLMKDIKRVWMYHGAEHKTINCYEAGQELTLENVKTFPTANRRCGTGFLFLVMVVSIILFSFVGWYSPVINALIRIALFPLVAGIAYEVIKVAGRYDNILTRIISAPGMLFQKLTAKEPDDDMIECAILAFNAVLPENEQEAKW